MNIKTARLAYSLSATAFLACSHYDVEAQSLFTDIIPDSHLYFNDCDSIDLDADGVNDLVVTCWYWISYSYPAWINANLEILNPSLSIGVASSGLPRPYLPGSLIGGSTGSFVHSGYGHLFGAGGVFGCFGEIDTVFNGGWGDIGDACLGYKMTKADGPHFGWLRIAADYSGVYLKEFSYELTPAVAVPACQYFAPPYAAQAIISNVECDTVLPLSGISDVNATLIPGVMPASVSEYRLFLVKQSDVASFDTTAAIAAIDPNQYLSSFTSTPTTLNLSGISLDCFGAPLSYYTNYVVVVLSIADGTISTFNTLSAPSEPFQKSNSVGDLENPIVSDVADFDNGADLHFDFDPAENEAAVEAYRLTLYPALLPVDLTDLLSVDTLNSVRIEVGTPRSGIFLPPDMDRNGDLLQQGREYKLCLLAEGTSSPGSSFKCTPIQLNDPEWLVDGISCEKDTAAAGFGAYTISFNPAAEDSIALSYRVLLKRRGEALPAPYELRQLPMDRYADAIFDGSVYKADLASIEKDINGAPFDPLRAYVPIILSKSATRGNQATESDIVLFQPEAATGSYTSTVVNGTEPFIRVHILPAPQDDFVTEYQAFIVKESSAASVDLNFALSLPADRLRLANPVGSLYQAEFFQGELDADGDPIAAGVSYRAFLLVEFDENSCPANGYNLKEAADSIALPINVGLNGSVQEQSLIYINGQTLVLLFNGNLKASIVELFDLHGRTQVKKSIQQGDLQIDLGAIPPGIYLIRVQTAEGVLTGKIYVD